jgi:hypothetical protein
MPLLKKVIKMKTKFVIWNHVLILPLFIFGIASGISLHQTWNTSVMGKAIGYGGIIPIDYNSDGKEDLFCTTHDEPYMDYSYSSYWYILSYDAQSNQYIPTHVSEVFEKGITTSAYDDFIGGSEKEYAIGTADGLLLFYSLPQINVIKRYQIEYTDTTKYYGSQQIKKVMPSISRISIHDADNNGEVDIVVHTPNAIMIFSKETMQLIHIVKFTSKSCDIGDIDGDSKNETVLSTGEMYRILPDTIVSLGRYRDSSVFRDPDDLDVYLVDTENDSVCEILNSYRGYKAQQITYFIELFDIDNDSTIWTLSPNWEFSAISVSKSNGTSILLVTDAPGGPSEFSGIHCYNLQSSEKLWRIPIVNDGRGASSPIIADIDGDNKEELFFVFNKNNTAATKILIYTLESKSLEWQSTAMGSPIYGFYAGDINNDGADEYLIAPHSDGTTYTDSAHVLEFDALTHQLKKVAKAGYANMIHDIQVADLDNDGSKELVIAGIDDYGVIYIVDANTFQQKNLFSFQYKLPPILNTRIVPRANGTGNDIIAGCSWVDGIPSTNYAVVSRISNSGEILWKSDTLPHGNITITGIEVCDFDKNGVNEIVSVGKSFLFYDEIDQRYDSLSAGAVTAMDTFFYNQDENPDAVLGTDSGEIIIVDGKSKSIVKKYSTPLRRISAIRTLPQLQNHFIVTNEGRLSVFNASDTTIKWQSERLDVNAGKLNRIFLCQRKNELPKVIVTTRRTVREFEIDTSSSSIAFIGTFNPIQKGFVKSASLSRNGILKISFLSTPSDNLDISIYDISGKNIVNIISKESKGKNLLIGTGNLNYANQLYLLRIKTKGKEWQGKLNTVR